MTRPIPKKNWAITRFMLVGLVLAGAAGLVANLLSGPDLAEQTMAMQRHVLREGSDPETSKDAIRLIMRNIDLLPVKDIQRVRHNLGRTVMDQSKQSASKYFQLAASDRQAFLDQEIQKLRLARALFNATNQGGMPVRTQESIDRAKRYRERKTTAQQKPQQSADKKLPAKQTKNPQVSDSPEKLFFEALLKRAEEQQIDLGGFHRLYGARRGYRG